MLFITCRKLIDFQSDNNSIVELARAKKFKEFDKEASPDNQVYFCEWIGNFGGKTNIVAEIGSLEFMKKTRAHQSTQVLFYIHGFNNQPEDAQYQGELLQQLTDIRTKDTKESILVIPIIWPCHDKTGIIRDYWDDQKSADMSGFPIARALALFVQWQKQNRRDDVPCFKQMNILAHSMGNRVLKEAMYNWGHYDSFSRVPMLFKNIFLVAADITERALESKQKGSYIPYATKNVVVYYAGDDRALQGSKLVNMEDRPLTRRLGHSGPTTASFVGTNNLYALDCDPVNSKYDPLGHTYFINAAKIEKGDKIPLNTDHAGLVHEHMVECMLTGKVSTKTKDVIQTNKKKPFRGFTLN